MQNETPISFPFGAPSVGRHDNKYPNEKEYEKCEKMD